MGFYHVSLPETAKTILKEGKDVFVVVAQSAAEALLVAKASVHLPSDEAWAAATATLLADSADLAGWRAKISIYDTVAALVEQVEVTGVTVADFDSIGALLVTALNLTTSIAGAAYSTPALTIAETTDSLGDHTVVAEFLPPTTWDDPTITFPAFYASLVHEGASGAALTVNLIDVATPEVLWKVRG